jgi:hypothetical protein
MAGLSPTQLTLRELRKQGYTAAVTERWNPFARIRQDLFGFVDVLGVGEKGTLAVQATSDSHVSERVKKIADCEHIGAVREAGWQIEVWGWKKVKNKWQCRVVDVS